jgi:hypothetical protein
MRVSSRLASASQAWRVPSILVASLRRRLVFTNSVPGQPDAAFIKLNDPTGAGLALIRDAVRRGYVVRTRAADTREARAGDPRGHRQALASAQWVSTDYPVPGIAARFGSSYYVRLPDGSVD